MHKQVLNYFFINGNKKMSLESNVYMFINKLIKFYYKVDYSDHVWEFIFSDKQDKWYRIHMLKYDNVFYINHIDGNLCPLEVVLNKSVKVAPTFGTCSYDENNIAEWDDVIIDAMKWFKMVNADWIKLNKKVYELYPWNRRRGIVPNALISASLKDIYRIGKELGAGRAKKFIRLVEEGYFHNEKNTIRAAMTANDFFNYCKIAYLSGKRKDDDIDDSLTGCEMYQRYADGRDNGLLEIDPNSEQEFADWIDGKHPKGTTGGHPFEIKRGGNTTHIDLYVSRPAYRKEGFIVTLCGASIARLKETICMFLGIVDKGLPISIVDPKGIRKRLLAADNVGIIPCFNSLHRANQNFCEHQEVYDVLYYDDLGKYKRRIKPFIIWDPLPVLRP